MRWRRRFGLAALVPPLGTVISLTLLAQPMGDSPPASTPLAVPSPSPTVGAVPAAPSGGPTAATSSPSPGSTLPPTPTPILVAAGSGELVVSPQAGRRFGAGTPALRFQVAVEDGIGLDVDELVAFVDETLADPRSWTGDGVTTLERVTSGGEVTLLVASPATVDRLCLPLDTAGIFSCARNGYVAINLIRWQTATEDWPADLDLYRRYVLNHEIGHYLLGPNHEPCPGPGLVAPIMMQQSKGLDGCLPNGWPAPDRTG